MSPLRLGPHGLLLTLCLLFRVSQDPSTNTPKTELMSPLCRAPSPGRATFYPAVVPRQLESSLAEPCLLLSNPVHTTLPSAPVSCYGPPLVKRVSLPHSPLRPPESPTQQPDWPLKKSQCSYSHRLSTASHHSHGSKPFTELTMAPPTSPGYLPPHPLFSSLSGFFFFCHSSQEWRPFFPPALILRLVSLCSRSCLCSGNIPSPTPTSH